MDRRPVTAAKCLGGLPHCAHLRILSLSRQRSRSGRLCSANLQVTSAMLRCIAAVSSMGSSAATSRHRL
ncbi:hypothetical protein PDR5_32470 [Pseudomonas sp. DR 5-09]|nr:hypothetical protein PDR5_32470 [Pseudomonas sp. DR 5-09]